MARDDDRHGRENNWERGRATMRYRNERDDENDFRSGEGWNPSRGGRDDRQYDEGGGNEPEYGRGGYGEGRSNQYEQSDWSSRERQGWGGGGQQNWGRQQRGGGGNEQYWERERRRGGQEGGGWGARQRRDWSSDREGGWRDRERGYSGGGYVPGGIAGSGQQGFWNQGHGNQDFGSFGNQGGWGSAGEYWSQQNQQGFGFQPGYGGEQGMRSDMSFRGGRPFEKNWDYESRYGQGTSERNHSGKGPSGYRRSDDRIREDINDRLTDHPWIDATAIEVMVEGAEVTLTGEVETRDEKRMAEDVAESIPGVKDVHNKIKTRRGVFGRMFGGGHAKREEIRRGMMVEDKDHRQVGTVREVSDNEITIQREGGDTMTVRFDDTKEVKNERLCLDRKLDELENRSQEEVGAGGRRNRSGTNRM